MKHVILAGVLLAASSGLSSAQQINTTGNGSLVYGSIGQTVNVSPRQRVSGVGQFFAAPSSASVLNDFTFFVGEGVGPDEMRYTAFLAPFTTSGSIIGPAIWSSAEWSSPTGGPVQPLTFTSNVSVTGGALYLAFIIPTFVGPITGVMEDTDLFATIQRSGPCCGGYVALLRDDWAFPPYSLEGAASISDFLRSPQPQFDVAFIANFSTSTVVPEPGTYGMLAIGLLLIRIVVVRQRRRSRSPAAA